MRRPQGKYRRFTLLVGTITIGLLPMLQPLIGTASADSGFCGVRVERTGVPADAGDFYVSYLMRNKCSSEFGFKLYFPSRSGYTSCETVHANSYYVYGSGIIDDNWEIHSCANPLATSSPPTAGSNSCGARRVQSANFPGTDVGYVVQNVCGSAHSFKPYYANVGRYGSCVAIGAGWFGVWGSPTATSNWQVINC